MSAPLTPDTSTAATERPGLTAHFNGHYWEIHRDGEEIAQTCPAKFLKAGDLGKETAEMFVTAVNERDSLLSDLAAARAKVEWQPTESAPSLVPVLCGGWIGSRWFQIVAEKVPAHAHAWVADSGVMTFKPTHWQPLPKPPALASCNQNEVG